MNLHRTDKLPEWELIPPADWNEYQQRAAETNGWDTPGNRETLKGIVGTSAGLYAIHQEHYLLGAGLVGYGRWKDIRDGQRAEETGTKSPKGEALDAATDKVLIAAAGYVAIKDKLLPSGHTESFIAENVATMALIGIAKARRRETHTNLPGKLKTFGEWFVLGAGVFKKIGQRFGFRRMEAVFDKTEKASYAATMGLVALSLAGYTFDAIGKRSHDELPNLVKKLLGDKPKSAPANSAEA